MDDKRGEKFINQIKKLELSDSDSRVYCPLCKRNLVADYIHMVMNARPDFNSQLAFLIASVDEFNLQLS